MTHTKHALTPLVLLSALLAGAPPDAPAQTDLVISEFLAQNVTNIVDEDNQHFDWIELYNPTSNTVSLAGWCLTDTTNHLTRWCFPATNVPPFSYLVVWASSKNRTNAGAPLHTSFALDADGEYLALVRVQGGVTNVVSAYAPRFPAQKPDISYGLPMLPGPFTTLVETGATARVLVPAADLGSGWTAVGFNDAGWLSGPTGIGFDASTNYQAAIQTDIQAQMLGSNATAYIRVPFTVTDPAQFQDMRLRMRFDDGFVAYLNGTEVARNNAPATVTWNSAATGFHGSEPGMAANLFADFDTSTPVYAASQQGNAPAPAIQNANAGSTGRFLRLLNDTINNNVNGISFDRVAPGAFPLITADFDFRMTDAAGNPADGFFFALLPTSVYGNSGGGINPIMTATAAAEEPNYPNVFTVGFDIYPHGERNDVSVHWNAVEYNNVTIPRSTIEMVSGAFHRCSVRVEYVPEGARVTVTIIPNINGTPGAPYVAINQLLIPGMPQYESRVMFGGRTGGADMALDLDNIRVNFFFPTGLVASEEWNISRFIPLLQPGPNVLAIQGLNVTATNGDFLILPQLLARTITLVTTSQVFLAETTPGAFNLGGERFLAPAVQFSLAGGVYTNDLVVELSSTLSNGVIRYTLNGVPPTEDSPLYTGPLSISNSVMVAARVWANGYLPSRPVSQTYTLLDPYAARFNSGLPIVILNAYGQVLFQDMEPRITAGITVIDTPQPTGRATPLGRPDYHGRAGIEGRGQTSWGFNKRPMNVEIRNDEDLDVEVPLLGMPKESDWILGNPYNDKTFLNDFLAYELFEQMGHYSVRRRLVEVFYNPGAGTTNWIGNGTRTDNSGKVGTNDYVGIYLLLERIKVDPSRVDIARLQPGDNAEPEITGGYIWKKDKVSPNDVLFYTTSGQDIRFHDPKGQDLTPAQRAWLQTHLNQFESALYASGWQTATGTNHYSYYMDVDSFVDQHWIVEFTKQIDGYRLSNYMHKDRNGKIKMEPIWDWNLSFGNCYYLQGGTTNGWYWTNEVEGISANLHIWLRQLITGSGSAFGTAGDPDFRQRITDRWGELRAALFHPSNLLARIDQLTNYLWEAQARDFARWPRLGTELWPNPNGTGRNGTAAPVEGWHVNYATTPTYAGIIGELKKWIIGRYNWVDSQFVKAPLLSRTSGFPEVPLGMYAPTGAVYYTVDGSDPRLPGGGLSPNARLYTNAFTLPPKARVVARAYAPSTNYMTPWTAWSPPARANFGYPKPSLAISELMYNPAGGEEYEFLEILNTGTNAIDLTGMRLADGVEFTFPSGPLQPTGTPTTNDFDNPGTAYTAATLGSGPGAVDTGGGPAGDFLRLATQGTGTNRTRIAFDQTAGGSYDRVVAEFDFRASNASSPPVTDTPTVQDFDSAGSTYWLHGFDTGEPATPRIMTDGSGPSGNYVRLTRQVGNESGGIYFSATEVATNPVVLVSFDFRCLGSADGFGFAFLNVTNAYGATGTNGIPAFSEEPNLAGSLGVGFDIYNNNAPPLEPNANHVSVHWNGAQVANGVFTPALSLSAGTFHRAEITLKFETSPAVRALVSVKITPDIYGAGGPPEMVFSNFIVNGAPAYRGRVAFCGRTGGAWANQDLDNISVQYLAGEPSPPGGLSMVFLPAGRFGTSGAGSTLADYLDAPAMSNAFALNFNFHAASFINEANLYWNGLQRGIAFPPSAALNLDNGLFYHARLELNRTDNGALAKLTLTPDLFGTPGVPVTVLSNVLVSGYAPGDVRVEFAARSGGQDLAVDVENVNVRYEISPNLLGAGQRVLVVKNRAAFESRYGPGRPIAGEYLGNLNNAGERILLLGRYGEPILEFRYDDDWYPLTDGTGFSLVNVNPTATTDLWSYATNWTAGSVFGGSPGTADPAPPAVVPVVINEILSRPDTNTVPGLMDAIELHNLSGTQSADVSYWYLTDNWDRPKKYRIPSPTVIPPGGFRVFYATNFNAPSQGTNAFGLQAEGEEVYLFSADAAGNLTGYYHGFDFGPSETNVTFGRYVDSEGDDQFVAQSAGTLGATNAGPKVGPVVITEVMYHPPDFAGGVDNTQDEFIELRNITGGAVDLGAWRLRDAVGFQFPTGVTLPASAYLVVVSFDPVVEPSRLDAFRTTYGLGPGVVILGPYEGKLDNSSDPVELARPVPFGTNASIEYVLVDKVKYHDDAPWPLAADGAGFSLHRLTQAAFGNDPINWAAGPPTPGAGFTPGTPPTIVTPPVSQTVLAGQTAVFSVTPGGAAPFGYQWRFNDAALVGATNASLTLPNCQPANAGSYQVVVVNAGGWVASAPVTLTVNQGPTILAQPQSVTTTNGGRATFSVAAVGNGLSYQWRLNGTNVPGATGSSLALTNVQYTNQGQYTVVLTDPIATVTSEPATLTLLIKAAFTVQPQSQVVPVGSTLTLTTAVNEDATRPVYFRWRRGGSTMVAGNYDSTTSAFVTNNIGTNQAGVWSVVMSNIVTSSILGSNAYVTVVIPPTNLVVEAGSNAVFSVTAVGPTRALYQWLAGVNVLTNQTNATLVLTNVQAAQAGTYSVVVSSWTNGVVASAGFEATLALAAADADGDGIPDWWETLYGFDPDDPADAQGDADGDTMSNRQEYIAGTDPTNALSYLKVDTLTVTNSARVSFQAVSNRTYTVQFNDDLRTTNWGPLAIVPAQPTNRVATVTDTNAAPRRFYRLVIPPAP